MSEKLVYVSRHRPTSGDVQHVTCLCPMIKGYPRSYMMVPARLVPHVRVCGRSTCQKRLRQGI